MTGVRKLAHHRHQQTTAAALLTCH